MFKITSYLKGPNEYYDEVCFQTKEFKEYCTADYQCRDQLICNFDTDKYGSLGNLS